MECLITIRDKVGSVSKHQQVGFSCPEAIATYIIDQHPLRNTLPDIWLDTMRMTTIKNSRLSGGVWYYYDTITKLKYTCKSVDEE